MSDKTKNNPLKNFKNVMYLIWQYLGLPEPTPIQYDIAEFLSTTEERRVIVEAFRGVGKSYITVALAVWLLNNDPDVKIMVVSASKTRADDFSTFVKRLITEIPLFSHLSADGDKNKRWSNIAFDVAGSVASGSPSVKSVGITGQLTGSRADVIISDDVESPNNSMTQEMRDKLAERVKEFDAVLKPGGRVIYLGTPQTEMSLYNVLRERGYILRIWPSEFPTLENLERKYRNTISPYIANQLYEKPTLVGQPTDPKRFSSAELADRKLSYGKAGYALQFMLDTSLSDDDKYPLKLRDLIVCPVDNDQAPEQYVYGCFDHAKDLPTVGLAGDKYFYPQDMIGRKPYTTTIMAIDPSGRGADETAYVVLKGLNGNLHLIKAGGIRGSGYSDDSLTFLANLAKQYHVNQIIVESNFGDGMYSALFQPIINRIYPCGIEEVRHNTQKELRIIDSLEPVMSQHRLIIDPKVIEDDYNSCMSNGMENANQFMLFYQMTRMCSDKGAIAHDDRIDALSIGVRWFTDQLSLDDEKQREKAYDKALEEAFTGQFNLLNGSTHPLEFGRKSHNKDFAVQTYKDKNQRELVTHKRPNGISSRSFMGSRRY